MPMGDGRCSLCGYWHSPGSDHIGPLRTYGHCARCGNEHSVGPCPVVEEPMRFPSRAERQQIARMVTNPSPDDSPAARQFEAEEHEQRQMRALARWKRQRLIEQAVRDAALQKHLPLRTWAIMFEGHVAGIPLGGCASCEPFVAAIRARFRELANGEGATRPAAGR